MIGFQRRHAAHAERHRLEWVRNRVASGGAPESAGAARPRQLDWKERFGIAVQRAAGRLLSPVWVPATVALMRFGFGWRVAGMPAARREFRALGRASDGPLLVCANHLTMIDS